MKRFLILSLVFLLLACASASQSKPATPADASEEGVSEVSTEAEIPEVPDNSVPDTSALPYIDALSGEIKTDWTALWIWTSSCAEDSYVAFRKTFSLDTAPESVRACISAESKYTLWVNGVLKVLDGSAKRGPTPVDCYYDEVELDGFTSGDNTITVLVAFNGRSGYSSVTPVLKNGDGDLDPQAGFLFEAIIGDQLITSDTSWKCLRLPTYRNAATARGEYQSYPMGVQLAERNLWFDARHDIGVWYSDDFDDSSWESATLVAKPGQLPFGSTYRSLFPSPRFGDLVDFVNVSDYIGKTLVSDTVLELLLPENTQFTFAFELDASEGQRLTIYTDSYQAWNDGIASFKDTYITKDGLQSYEQYPWRSGSRLYIEAPAGVTFHKLQYRISGFNADPVPAFTSSDERIDALWQKAWNTINICIRDSFMDCPDRERAAYAGDAANQGVSVLYGYDVTSLSLIRKNLLTALGWTGSDHVISSQIPGNNTRELPNQTLALIDLGYVYWMYSGDQQTTRDFYRMAVNYLKLYDMKDGLPVNRAGDWNWCDWGNYIDGELLQVCFYYLCLNDMLRISDDLSIAEDRDFLTERIGSIADSFRQAYDTQDGYKSPGARQIDERANAMAAYCGLADESEYCRITDIIMSTYEASPYMERFILESLGKMGRTEEMKTRMLDRYSEMIDDPATTLWERFVKEEGTFNHGWSSGPLYVISRYIAGIRPTAAGWESYEIVPSDVLESYTCTVDTVKGRIVLQKNGDSVTVTVPCGGGQVVLPDGQIHNIDDAGTYSFRISN